MTAQSPARPAQIAPRDDLSYVRGVADTPLSEATVPRFMLDTVTRFAGRPAVVFREQQIRWSWAEFAAEVDALASGLSALGLEKGDRLGIWSPNRAEWLVTQFATARIGVILVNINPAYQLAELEYALTLVGCRALIAAPRFKASDYLAMLGTLAPELATAPPGKLRAARLPSLEIVIRMGANPAHGTNAANAIDATGVTGAANAAAMAQDPSQGVPPEGTAVAGMFHYDAVVERGRTAVDPGWLQRTLATLDSHEAINIQFTSGTTGNPKGATLSHRNIVNNARFIAQAMNLGERDSLCIPVPLYHCFGMVLAVLACVSAGATMVFPGEAFEPLATLRAVVDERCTALHGVPTMFIAELDHPEFKNIDLGSLRTGIMAGSPCPIETMKQVVAQMHLAEITIAYGMTETSPVSFQSSTADPLERRTTTVGRIQPHLEAKIVDALGATVPVGQTGQLCVKGYSVMTGYWGNEAKTHEAVVDGWMHTEDLAVLDHEGYCNIVGRLKDMVIRGGENIYPREIEEFLFRHPKIQSVQVFGVPDSKYGEEICAWIILKTGHDASTDEIREFCRGQIAHFKIPRYVRFVEALPMTVTGKVQKFVMREQMMVELKLLAADTA
jgi:fatty-acyl-CoA synthase